MDKLRYAAAVAAALTVGGTAQPAEWTVDKAMSSVGFVAEQQGSRFNGRFETFDATIDFDPGKPDAGKIMGTVVTDTVNTRDHDRDAALTDRDWFDSANFAEASFESSTITEVGDGQFEAAGELTLKGNTKPATMAFSFVKATNGAQFDGTMSIDRFNFNVGEGWNDTSWVGQNVEIQVKLALGE